MSLRLGLVLCGGGGKGAYQIGVLKALKECGITQQISALAGTSIGALNGVMLMQGDIEAAEEAWLSVTPSQVFGYDTAEIPEGAGFNRLPAIVKTALRQPLRRGVFSHKGIEELLERYVDLKKVASCALPGYASCCCIWPPTGAAEYLRIDNQSPERLRRILLATSAIPLVFEDVEIDGKKYCDGGVIDNAPIRPVYREGCDVIIVVHLDYIVRDYSRFSQSRIFHIMPSERLGNFLDGVLDFDRDNIKWRLKLGYRDARLLSDEIHEAIEEASVV